ncbi:MAG: LCP family protein [Clostridia bacterium]|nr:LCP family protein [Clostridia bacterium]
MDIYSNSKKAKHVKKKAKKKGNIFVRFKDWLLSMSVGKRSVVISLLCFLLVAIILISVILGYVIKLVTTYNYDKDFGINNVEPISEDVVNIALFGLDTRDRNSFKGRSDSIMILSLSKKDNQIKLISVMRDSLVEIPGYSGGRKINTAYSLGGPELAVKTLNTVFGLDIREYATVNFYGMADIIDAVGGIEVNVLEAERNAVNGLNPNIKQQALSEGKSPDYVEKAGLQKLNGMQAVAWARIRSVATADGENNDFGRTDRQRYVMEQLLNKALSMSATEYPRVIDKMIPYMKTSLSPSEILSLTPILAKGVGFEESRIPHNKYIINSNFYAAGAGSTVYYNTDYASKVLLAYIYDGISPEDYMEQNGIDKTGWFGGSSYKPSGSTGQSGTSSKAPTSSAPSVKPPQQSSSTPEPSNVSSDASSENIDSSVPVDTETPSEDTGSVETPSEDNPPVPSEPGDTTEQPDTSTEDTTTEISPAA